MEIDLEYRCAANIDEPEAAPATPVAAVSVSPDPALRPLDGGRAAIERELLRAAVFDRSWFTALLRQLTPSANDAFFGLPSSGEPRPPRRSDA